MTLQIVLLFIGLIILPGYLLFKILVPNEKSLLMWILRVSYTGAFMGYIFFAGPWSWLSYYLRYLFLGLFIVFTIVSFTKLKDLPFTRSEVKNNIWPLANYGFSLLVGLGLFGMAIRGQYYSGSAVHLHLPFEERNFYVGQGGNSIVLNYHQNNQSQQFAVDILKLNKFGRRAEGLYPSDLEKYEIYGQSVTSPCNGQVQKTVSRLPDLTPPDRDQEHPAGNHVILTCKGARILLAHLQEGSVTVEAGEMVTTGQRLGLVGNSGNTTEPHLHIHAVDGEDAEIINGEARPILFGGQFPTRNMVLSVSE